MLVLVLCFFNQGFAQAEGEDQSPEANEKLSLRMSFDVYKINDDYKLVAKARVKINNRYQFISDVNVDFYTGESDAQIHLGKGVTNEKGEASLIVKSNQISAQTTPYAFSVLAQNNSKYDDEEKSVMVNSGQLKMDLMEEDSVKTVKLFVGALDSTGQVVPMEDASCQLYVKRLFGKLPVGDAESTDEEGQVTFEFPGDIPGDEKGNITIIASIAENEVIGNIETNQIMAWGQPITEEYFFSKRELWSARANSPISLIIIVNAVLIGVWGVIFYIFLEINRIHKIGKIS